ncbi:ATP-dependent DNA helicase [Kineobactrum sediminis]|uniref:ATP-dependent DNA helicase n=1 Tax=Kineobactrum sediminis TaxID=1905677 RepID=A0A2N5Y790_9GAMM|nr:ATP-dependent DNA helicase [Kineobactrum sediminis]PLW84260.1 ATP-dependent DNA helicase [Kineobactrum sediminis]
MTEFTITVRDLALFCHRQGDIDHRFTPSPTAMQGIEGHQRVYRDRPASYQREFSVSYSAPVAGLGLRVRGRADGYDQTRALVEEIKTCRVDPARIPEPVTRLHLAQGRLYAAMIAEQEDLQALTVQLTWLELDKDREHSLQQDYSRAELRAFLEDSLHRYGTWLALVQAHRARRDLSLRDLPFPHRGFRPGQRELSERVYKCVHQAGRLLLEAPTGIGKTVAVLYPALKALATGRHERIVFTTGKISGRRTAEHTFDQLMRAGYAGNALSLTAKEQVCLSPGRACHGEDCPYARGYYDRLPAARAAALDTQQLDRPALESLARRFEVCPYQLSLDLAPWVDMIIADVHHVFSLTANLAERLAASAERWTVLLDEAHTLPERARQMYGAELARSTLVLARKEAPAVVKKLLDRCNRQFLALEKARLPGAQNEWHESIPDKLHKVLQACFEKLGEQLALDPLLLQQRPALRDWHFAVLQFLRVVELWGDEFRLEVVADTGGQGPRLLLHCLDPGRLLALRHEPVHALVAFSATLTPQRWTLDSLGLDQEAVAYRARSSFAREQLQVQLATHIDTRYQQRQHSLPALAALLRQWLDMVPGNCLLYFSSYSYLQSCLVELEAQGWPEGRLRWVQAPGQDADARGSLLRQLGERRDVAAFCVLGGAFGEGIDLPGDDLSSVVVVGVGLPQVNAANEQLRNHYQKHYGSGFAHAYQYPGMQKVSQALGRVVRLETDYGRALLVDGRYSDPAYRALLPPWWTYRMGPLQEGPV